MQQREAWASSLLLLAVSPGLRIAGYLLPNASINVFYKNVDKRKTALRAHRTRG